MKTFEYRGFDAGQRACRGLVEALDLKEAREKLAQRGILAEKIGPAGARRPARLKLGEAEFGTATRAMLYREAGSLVHAGLPLANALEVMIEAPELGESRSCLAGVRDRIREGSAFAAAMAAASTAVTPFELAVIEVGERAGTLDAVLDRLAGYLEEQQRLKERIQTAMIYPAIVLALAVVVAILMLGVMIPRVAQLLRDTGVVLPLLTRVTLAAGRLALPVAVPVAAVLAVGWFVIRRQMEQDADYRILWDRRWFRLPVVGRGYTVLVNLRFARTLAVLLGGGVPLVDGIGLAGRASGSPWVGRLALGAADAVRHGRSLADAIRMIPPLGGSLPGWIQAGEASGKIEGLLEHAAVRYQQEWDRLITRSLGVLEPVLILAVGGFVLLVALSILLPILSLNRSLM